MEVLSADNKIMTVNGKLAKAPSITGTGDMKKSVYDPTGTVEQAGGIPDYVAGQLPTVNDATLTIQKNGVAVGTFTANASANKSINITMAKGDVGLSNVDNVKQYSADNPPPYPVTSVAGKTGAVTLTKADVGLGNVDNTSDANKPISTATQTALNGKLDKTAVVDVTADAIKGQAADAKSVYDVIQALPTGTDISLGLTAATVGQTIKVKAVDTDGKPTAWEAVEMSGGGGGHWETVLDTVWEQDVINPTAYDAATGIFTCAEGELNNLELNKEYVFFQQCTKEGAAYNTILNNENMKLTKLSDTTFSIDVTPPTTFVPTNVKFSRGACMAITDIDVKKIRLTLDGQFKPTATLYDRPFYGMNVSYFGRNTGYIQIRSAYQAYQQVTAEVESPYRIVGEILCGFNAPSQNASFHFKNNSFCCPLVPYDVPQGNERNYFLTSDGTKIAKLYSTKAPWFLGSSNENLAILNDSLKIISGTKVKLERWVE